MANISVANFPSFTQNFTSIRCSFRLSILQFDKRKKTLYLKPCSLSTKKISATGKRHFNQLICTNLATLIGFSRNQFELRNSNRPRIFVHLVYFWHLVYVIVRGASIKSWYWQRSILRDNTWDARFEIWMGERLTCYIPWAWVWTRKSQLVIDFSS